MTIWLHSAVLATTLAATAAIGIASAGIYSAIGEPATKSDRLAGVELCRMAGLDGSAGCDRAPGYVTVEERGEGVSILTRIPLPRQ